jgi:hypothetical protein
MFRSYDRLQAEIYTAEIIKTDNDPLNKLVEQLSKSSCVDGNPSPPSYKYTMTEHYDVKHATAVIS